MCSILHIGQFSTPNSNLPVKSFIRLTRKETKNFERVYVGETGRPMGARVKEHRKSSLEQKRPGQPVSATNLQSQIMFATLQ